ncbi:MAG: hypothetical protein UY76_C0002G0019 [Candidatus Uhrbacteria bacterium GW2011_GWA2_52_8d]|uniref:Uncharacterized protein n=1 Tax=Candidatus Uhrbacteria bacterium GW2011_GWA2_52_8d TaxID=1618979 RepID=A0A0G1XRD3_9BACT|nr:MAG: hypothetical protein UY76_C0002G0019 [Candidatus Uhrbacteria bacterium GW2011_GWA2_52_8d]
MFPNVLADMAMLLPPPQTISLFDLLVVILYFFVPPAIMVFAMNEAEHRYQSLKG